MWKSVHTLSKIFSSSNTLCKKPLLRKYLTSAFSCNEAWAKRLDSPYLKKINLTDMFYEIENQFLHFGKANGIDIDLFANAIVDDVHLDEVEDVIHKLRLSTEAANLLPSTQHAFIRVMLSHADVNELLRILDDRLNYGIFMDNHCCILLLNKFLKEKNYQTAARVATIQMLQEDFSHPIVKYMSLFACHNFILNPESWIPKETETQTDQKKDSEEEEEEWLRVPYIRNYFFDDHFDLRNPNHLVGKTLWMIGNEIPDSLGHSYSLIGYAFHEKWAKLVDYCEELLRLKEEPVVFKDSIDIVRDFVINRQDTSTDEKSKDDFANTKEKILNLLNKFTNSNLCSEEELLKTTESKMKAVIAEKEANTINNQIQIYDQWEKERVQLINDHIEKLKCEQTKSDIETAKRQLKEREEELFFFENEDKLDVIIENKHVRYPKKWLGKKKPKRSVDMEYVPPEVEKRREKIN